MEVGRRWWEQCVAWRVWIVWMIRWRHSVQSCAAGLVQPQLQAADRWGGWMEIRSFVPLRSCFLVQLPNFRKTAMVSIGFYKCCCVCLTHWIVSRRAITQGKRRGFCPVSNTNGRCSLSKLCWIPRYSLLTVSPHSQMPASDQRAGCPPLALWLGTSWYISTGSLQAQQCIYFRS